MLRLFVAIKLPDNIITQLAAIMSGLRNARWVHRSNLHITLCFIGEVTTFMAEDLHFELSKVHFNQFDLALSGVDVFGSRNIVRSIWVGIADSTELNKLQKTISTLISAAGFQIESKKFTPHVTLARFNKKPNSNIIPYLEANASFQTPQFKINNICLYRSHIGKQSTTYEVLAQYPKNNS